nr:MAG: hypothetical protein 1 [Beijing sediment noda-like virus 9]
MIFNKLNINLPQVSVEERVAIMHRLYMIRRGVGSVFQRGAGQFTKRTITSGQTKFIIGGLAATMAGYYAYNNLNADNIRHAAFNTQVGNKIYSWITDNLSTRLGPDNRQQVKDIVMRMSHSQPRNHSHPNAARVRCKANMFMQQACMMLGRRSYNYQLSPTQQRLQNAGCRTIYCAKDLQMAYQDNSLLKDDIIVMTDVDYYINMANVLQGNPVLMYTFVPLEVSGTTEDGIYYTHSDDTVETVTNGGSRYRHQLWDYDDDHIVIDTWKGSYIYLIEQIRVTDTRRLIYFNPVRFVPWVLGWILPGRRLRRRQFNKGGVMYSRFTKTNDEGVVELWHSMAYAEETPACTIRSDTFQAAHIRLCSNKTPHISDVERYFSTHKVDNTLHAATLFFDIYNRCPEVFGVKPNMVTPCVIQNDTHSYQSVDGLTSEDGKPTMRALWPGYGKGIAFSPVKSYNNDKACLKGRIEDVKNRRYPIPPIYYSYLHELVGLMVPSSKMGSVTPMSYEQIWDKFDKATQRSKLAQADFSMEGNVTVRSFQKVEAYGKLTAPRNISTLPMSHNATLGQYTIPLMTHIFKECHWYAFGKHPRHISQLLHEKSRGTVSATASDFTKLDGSIQEYFRDGFDMVAFAAVNRDYHAEWLRISKKERNVKCRTAHDIIYYSDATVLSGSSMTSLLGTFVNVVTNYIALRTQYGPSEAWARLGLYGGDDGVSFDVPGAWITKTAAKLGLLCETEEVAIGNPIKFLGRIYPDIWTTPASTADVKRQVSKLHLTGSPKIVPDWLVLYRKAQGLRCTDENTPFLTMWCDAVMRIVRTQQCEDPENHKYWHLTKADQAYWSKYQTPFEAPTDVEHIRGIIAEEFGLTTAELVDYERRVAEARTLEELQFEDMIRKPVKVGLTVTINGETIIANDKKDVQAEILKAQQLKTSLCRFVRRGNKCPYPHCKYMHSIAKVDNQENPSPTPPIASPKSTTFRGQNTRTTTTPAPKPNKAAIKGTRPPNNKASSTPTRTQQQTTRPVAIIAARPNGNKQSNAFKAVAQSVVFVAGPRSSRVDTRNSQLKSKPPPVVKTQTYTNSNLVVQPQVYVNSKLTPPVPTTPPPSSAKRSNSTDSWAIIILSSSTQSDKRSGRREGRRPVN